MSTVNSSINMGICLRLLSRTVTAEQLCRLLHWTNQSAVTAVHRWQKVFTVMWMGKIVKY